MKPATPAKIKYEWRKELVCLTGHGYILRISPIGKDSFYWTVEHKHMGETRGVASCSPDIDNLPSSMATAKTQAIAAMDRDIAKFIPSPFWGKPVWDESNLPEKPENVPTIIFLEKYWKEDSKIKQAYWDGRVWKILEEATPAK